MWRVVLRPALLFLAPFLLYGAWLVLSRTTPFARRHWGGRVVSNLTIVGLVVAVMGMFAFGFFADRRFGAYVPAHIENGTLVPGHIQ
jgi:hypothetical protein